MAGPNDHRLVPACRVSVGGSKLESAEAANLRRVSVDLDNDLFGACVLSFNDPGLALINGKKFESGTAVKVEIGFASKLTKVFEGEVVALEPQFRREGVALLVKCHESIHRLALSQMTRTFNDADESEVVSKIAQEHGLQAEGPKGTKQHFLQSNVTDASFLRRLARKHGGSLRISGKKLIVGPPPAEAEMTLSPGETVRSMKVKLDARSQVAEVAVHGWDPVQKKEFFHKTKAQGDTGQGSKKFGKGQLAIAGHEEQAKDTATAEKMAKGRMQRLAESYATATGEIVGDPRAVPGAKVSLEKIGAKVDGVYRIDHARHEWSKHGYFVHFKAARISEKSAGAAKAEKAQAQSQQQAKDERDDAARDDQKRGIPKSQTKAAKEKAANQKPPSNPAEAKRWTSEEKDDIHARIEAKLSPESVDVEIHVDLKIDRLEAEAHVDLKVGESIEAEVSGSASPQKSAD